MCVKLLQGQGGPRACVTFIAHVEIGTRTPPLGTWATITPAWEAVNKIWVSGPPSLRPESFERECGVHPPSLTRAPWARDLRLSLLARVGWRGSGGEGSIANARAARWMWATCKHSPRAARGSGTGAPPGNPAPGERALLRCREGVQRTGLILEA